MAKANFMSMRWLREHVKVLIWATVSLFLLSIFVIGYGTSRQIAKQEERKKEAEQAEAQAERARNAIPAHLRDKINHPVVHISYPTANASLTTILDVKEVWQSVKDSPEYKQLAQMPAGIKDFYGKMLKERALDNLITFSLIELYAQANNIKPQITVQAIVEKDRQQLSPVEFERKLRREGLTAKEYGSQRIKQLTYQSVMASLIKPIPLASATDNVIKNYYETNKIRFKKDDEITFEHLVVSPSDFAGKQEVSDEQIKNYFDANRSKLVSSKRAQALHIYINHQSKDFLDTITISEKEIRRRYTENLKKFKEEEKVRARHILIKPKNNFDYEFPNFKANLRNFTSADKEDKVLFTFDAGLSMLKSSTEINFDNISLTTEDGQSFFPTEESQKAAERSLELPLTGSSKPAVFGKIGIFVEKGLAPKTLSIKDGAITGNFDITTAFDAEKAMEAAKAEAESVLKKLKAGADFAKLATEISEDKGSAKKGGDLGAFKRGDMVKPFENAAFTTKVGDITEPVKSQFGYHIIKVEEKISATTKPLDEVRAQLVKEIKQEQAEIKAAAALEGARRKISYKNETFESMVKLHSMGASRKDGGKLPVFFKGEITEDYSADQQAILKAEICDSNDKISEKIEKAVFALQNGQVSEVIQTANGFHLFKLVEILDPIQLALTPTLKTTIHGILEKDARKELAKKKADELAPNKDKGIKQLAKLYKPEDDKLKIEYGPIPFSKNPGFSSYALSDGLGKFSEDGRTYLPELHKAIMTVVKAGEWENRVLGPIKSELGYHFIKISKYSGEQYEDFDKIKDEIKKMLTFEPSEDDIKTQFEASKDKLDKPATRKIRQIVVDEENLANEIYKRLQEGEIFALLAKTYSIDGSAQRGGLIPPIKKGQLSAKLDEAIWNLKKTEFTKPIKTAYGYVIALLDADEIPGVKATLSANIRSAIKRQLKSKYQEDLWVSFLKGLRNQAYLIRHPKTLAEI